MFLNRFEMGLRIFDRHFCDFGLMPIYLWFFQASDIRGTSLHGATN